MTVSQKASLSLLISVFLFAIFTVVSFVGLFDLVETRFYNPSITKNLSRDLQQDTRTIQDYIKELDTRFSITIQNEAVRRSFLPNQSAEDIFERSKLFGTLMESLGGLQSVRFVDAAGRRIHYSTLLSDILHQDRLSISYRNYEEENEPFPYNEISVPNRGETKLTLDSSQDRMLFSLPFYDSYNVYRGTAIFSLSVRAISDRLLSEGLIKYGEDVSIISGPSGIVIGMPRAGKDALVNAVRTVWNEGITTLTPLDSGNNGLSFALISAKTDQGIFIGKIADEALFEFPFAMKLILLASFFLTTYLIIFLLFNLQQDSMTVIQNRLKRLQISLFEEYYDRKGDMDWSRWSRELEQRREEVRNELKRGIKTKPGSRGDLDIDTLFDKSWDEMAAVMGSREQPQINANIDEDKLSSILNRVLAAASNVPASAGIPELPRETQKADNRKIPDEPDDLEELGDAEEVAPTAEPEELLEELEEDKTSPEEEVPEDLEELEDEGEPVTTAESADPIEELEEITAPPDSEVLEDLEELNEESDSSLEELEEIPLSEETEVVEELGDADEPVPMETSQEIPAEENIADIAEQLEELEELDDADGPDSSIHLEKAEAGQEKKHPSNIRLAFGDDDIPYIVETSGLELVDDDVDSVIDIINQNETSAEPEELEELDEADSNERSKKMSEEDISRLASEIEFSTVDEQDEDLDHNLEIYSPFDNIFVDDDIPPEEPEDSSAPSANLEEVNSSYTMSLVYKPFQSETMNNPPELEQVDSGQDSADTAEEIEEIPEEVLSQSGDPQDDTVIEERDGVNYIRDSNISTNGKNLDPNFKDLVESVLKKKDEE